MLAHRPVDAVAQPNVLDLGERLAAGKHDQKGEEGPVAEPVQGEACVGRRTMDEPQEPSQPEHTQETDARKATAPGMTGIVKQNDRHVQRVALEPGRRDGASYKHDRLQREHGPHESMSRS